MRKYRTKHKRFGGFRSPLELRVSKILGKRAKFESEKLNYFLPKRYVPDFVVTNKDGSKIYYEVKGYLRYEDQRKMRAVKFSNPDLRIIFIFPENKRHAKVHTSNMTHPEWAEKYGFEYQFVSDK